MAPHNASIVDPADVGPAIGFLRVLEGKTSKNRMHIDVRVAGKGPWDMDASASLIRAKVLGHVVMLDPEGNEFCGA